MRRVIFLIALFSSGNLAAQEFATSCGLEKPRSEIRTYPSAEEAAAAGNDANRYGYPVTEWERSGDLFSTSFTVPFAWINRMVLFRLDWASHDYEIIVNGETVAYNADGNCPAEADITKYVAEGRNTLEIKFLKTPSVTALESWNRTSKMAIGPARIMSQPILRIRDLGTRTSLTGGGDASAEIAVVVKTASLNPRTSRLHYTLLSPSGQTVTSGSQQITLAMRGEDTVRILARIPSDSLWSDSRTTHYRLRLKMQHEGRYVEYLDRAVAFRSIEMMPDGSMKINGRTVNLNPQEVSGSLSPAQVAELRQKGTTAIRLLPGAVSESMLAACDTCGVYVIAQAPIDTYLRGMSRGISGNPSNDPRWRKAYIERAENAYHTQQLHPSVIAFSLATRSANGINLYESYLRMKRLPESRPFIYPDANGEWNSDLMMWGNWGKN